MPAAPTSVLAPPGNSPEAPARVLGAEAGVIRLRFLARAWTPLGRLCYTSAVDPTREDSVTRAAFSVRPLVPGTSGTPDFVLWDGRLHLFRIISSSNGTGTQVWPWIDYIRSMILRCDAAQGISTGLEPRVANYIFIPNS